ncbi:Clr5 domain-containing protein [Xylaria intraflava]|nr:Clr5 domain-containing protein [Xylaria intraflava]
MQSSAAGLVAEGAEHHRVEYAKPSEWAAQKDVIKKLYLDENKTLDEVRRIMADEHQFHATPSMYKKRIRTWHFTKKLEEDAVLEVLQQKLQKKAAGEISIRGRVVRNQRLRRFLERRPDVLARLQIQMGSPSSPCEVPAEVPRVRSLSPEFRNMENTMTAVRDYIRGCAFGPDALWIWTPGGYTSRRGGITDFRASRLDMLRAIDEFYYLQAAIDNEKPSREIFRLLNSTLNRLSGAIRTELPDFFFQMIEVLQHTWSNHSELSDIFRRHVAELAVVHLGRNHPMSILWIHMLREQQDGYSVGVSRNVLDMLLQELVMSIGAQDHLTGVALDYLLRYIIHTQGPFVAWKRFKTWLATYPRWDEPSSWSKAVQSRLEISNEPMTVSNDRIGDTSRWTSAAMEYQKPGSDSFIDLHSSYLLSYLAGRIAIRNGDSERAEGWFLKAKTVAQQFTLPRKTDYFTKAFANLHVLYTATNQPEKLAAITEELENFKLELPVGTKWPTESMPDC